MQTGATQSSAWDVLAVLSKFLDLGDTRLDNRARRMARACLGSESVSLARMFEVAGKKDLKGAQRFLSNGSVSLERLRGALYDTAFARTRLQGLKSAIVAFDR